MAAENLTKPVIAEAVAAAIQARSDRTGIDADWLLRRLAEEAEADLADILFEYGSLKPVRDWPAVWRKGLVAGLEVEEVRMAGVVVGVMRKVKLSDRVRRLELIGKHVNIQAFRENVGLTGKNGDPVQIEVIKRDADEFARRIAGIASASGSGEGTPET